MPCFVNAYNYVIIIVSFNCLFISYFQDSTENIKVLNPKMIMAL